MGKPTRPLSPALLAGQYQLLALRKQRQAKRPIARLSVVAPSPCSPSPKPIISSQLPDHLGWGSPAITAVLRKIGSVSMRASEYTGRRVSETAGTKTRKPAHMQTHRLANSQTCKLYPDVAMGMLRQEQAAAGRVWLLLRHIDNAGQGWVSLEETREKLTRKEASLRVCGWRQLRNLLNQGDGLFWERRNGRVWLHSVAKVAAALNVWRLNNQPVAIPITTLLQGMGQVRAHLYASFHSGRAGDDKKGSPIARDTIAEISRVNKRTQRLYEQRARVRKKHNFAIGPQTNDLNEENIAWQHGRAAFQLTDQAGRHGRKGATYLAWQLPNSYTGPHTKQPRGRQKRINRELADLFMKGMTGNGKDMVDAEWRQKRYFENGRSAGKVYKYANDPIYWQNSQQCNRYQLWYVLKETNDYKTNDQESN